MALAIVNASSGNPGTGASFTTTYTNASACVMILHVVTRCGSAGFSTVSSVTDSAGITWQRRNQVQFNSTNFSGINACTKMTHEVWWANITATHGSPVTITVNLANDANQVTSTLYNQFQVTGSLVPATPWDINGGATQQATYSNASVNSDPSANWAVSSSAALVLEFLSENGATGSTGISSPGTGYGLVTGIQIGTSGTGISHQGVANKTTGASGSGTATWTSVANIREWVNVTDALTSDSNGTAFPAGSASGTITTTLTKANISANAAMNVPALHGTPVETNDTSGTATSISATITTTVPTVVVAVINAYNFAGSGAIRTVTGVSGGGLTWTKRSSTAGQSGTSFSLSQEVWWANATGSLTAQSITASFSAAPSQNCTLSLFAFSGSPSPSSPWDANGSLPSVQSALSTGSLVPMTRSGTTTSTNSLQLAFAGYAWNNHPASSTPTGYADLIAPHISTSLNTFAEQKASVASGAFSVTWGGNQEYWTATLDALKGDAVVSPTGTITTALTKGSMAAAAKETFTGAINTALTKVSIAAMAATEIFTGTITTRLTKISQGANGSTTGGAPPGNTGSIATHLSGISQHATDIEVFTGTITTHLPGLAQNAVVAVEIIVGTVVTRLTRANFSVAAEERVIGHAVTRLNSAFGQTIANVVQAEVIVLGPIIMALPPFRSVVLGALLGAPGAGKWYSWRYTDS